MSVFKRYYLPIILLWCLLCSRLIGIVSYPVFIDETIHIHTAERLQDTSPLLNVDLARSLTFWYLWCFQATRAYDPIWVARMAIVLSSLLGAAALYQMAHALAGNVGLAAVALFLIASPYHHFFERLALADGLAAALVLVSIAAAYRLRNRLHYADAVVCGAALALAILAKVNVLPYAGIVLAAGVAHYGKHPSKRLLMWCGIALTTLLLPLAAFEVLVQITGNAWLVSTFHYISSRSRPETALWQRLSQHIIATWQFAAAYLHPALLLTFLIAALLNTRRQIFLLLVWLAPMVVLWLGEPQETRYWLVPMGLLALLALTNLIMTFNARRFLQYAILCLLLLWAGSYTLPFAIDSIRDPHQMALPATDQRQYINSDATGFGFSRIPHYLPSDNRPQLLGILANCQGARYTLWDQYDVLCRSINPNGSDIDNLLVWVDQYRGQVPYVILEDSPYLPPTIEGTPIATIRRPNNQANLRLIDIRP